VGRSFKGGAFLAGIGGSGFIGIRSSLEETVIRSRTEKRAMKRKKKGGQGAVLYGQSQSGGQGIERCYKKWGGGENKIWKHSGYCVAVRPDPRK